MEGGGGTSDVRPGGKEEESGVRRMEVPPRLVLPRSMRRAVATADNRQQTGLIARSGSRDSRPRTFADAPVPTPRRPLPTNCRTLGETAQRARGVQSLAGVLGHVAPTLSVEREDHEGVLRRPVPAPGATSGPANPETPPPAGPQGELRPGQGAGARPGPREVVRIVRIESAAAAHKATETGGVRADGCARARFLLCRKKDCSP
jgi:hypothetical protein